MGVRCLCALFQSSTEVHFYGTKIKFSLFLRGYTGSKSQEPGCGGERKESLRTLVTYRKQACPDATNSPSGHACYLFFERGEGRGLVVEGSQDAVCRFLHHFCREFQFGFAEIHVSLAL